MNPKVAVTDSANEHISAFVPENMVLDYPSVVGEGLGGRRATIGCRVPVAGVIVPPHPLWCN